ncbi:MAG: class I SAM-dependent methyltransferase [Candidatus Acidiferrum sp.]
MTRDRLLPRMLDGTELGTRVLELGAGSGTATAELLRRFPSVTSLEYRATPARKTAEAQFEGRAARMVRADAAQLPFADGSFTCAIAILMLHHLRSPELQDSAFAEIRRVLRPGGILLAFEIRDGWLQRLIHTCSTFVPVSASTANARLIAAGFARVSVDFMAGAFLLRAQRAAD